MSFLSASKSAAVDRPTTLRASSAEGLATVPMKIEQRSKAEAFRAFHVPGSPLVLFNIWDAGAAIAVANGGAKAIATSSWSVAHANGYEDGEQIPRDVAVQNLERIVRATDLPVSVDLESGYGDDPEVVAANISLAIRAGAVGCNLEDSYPKNGQLRDSADQVLRLRYARRAADAANMRFFINARCDVFFQRPSDQHDEALLDQAIARGHAFASGGADGFFVPGLVNQALIRRLVTAVPLPLNIMVEDATPAPRVLADCGVARVSHGPRPYLLTMKALEHYARQASRTGTVPLHGTVDGGRGDSAGGGTDWPRTPGEERPW